MSKASEDWHYLKIKGVLAPIHLLLGSTSWYLPAVAYASDRHVTNVVSVIVLSVLCYVCGVPVIRAVYQYLRTFTGILSRL